jgi:hypothetical protein
MWLRFLYSTTLAAPTAWILYSTLNSIYLFPVISGALKGLLLIVDLSLPQKILTYPGEALNVKQTR